MSSPNYSSLPSSNTISPYINFSNGLKQEIINQLEFMHRAEENLRLVNTDVLEGILALHYKNLAEISEYEELIGDISQRQLDTKQQKKLKTLRENIEEISNANAKIIALSKRCLEKIKRGEGNE